MKTSIFLESNPTPMFNNYLSILILLFSTLLNAQNTIDSLKRIEVTSVDKDIKSNLYYELSRTHNRPNADYALFYAREAIRSTGKEKIGTLIPWCHYQI